MNTLIVEDDISSQILFDRFLRGFGPTAKASDGQEALNHFEKSLKTGPRFDLVCLDIMLPGMNGQEILKVIRQMEEAAGIFGLQGCKILMLTALADSENIMSAFRAQCEGYLTKPIDYPHLIDELVKLDLVPATTSRVFSG